MKWGDGFVVRSVASFMRRRVEGDIFLSFLFFFSWLFVVVVWVYMVVDESVNVGVQVEMDSERPGCMT